jgi:hypothetical protein
MATFKEFFSSDIKTSRSSLNQLVDIVNTDISSSQTRRKYQVFVTGGVGPGVTSSLFQTVYDQDFTLQTANSVFDITFGFQTESELIAATNPSIDANGKFLFPQNTLMMREKIDIYRLFAQNLLGDANATFQTQVGNTTENIREALFISFKRLFARDQMKRETFAIRYQPSASHDSADVVAGNLDRNGEPGTLILTDINSSNQKDFSFGGQVSTVVDSSNTQNPLGLLFIDKGILVLDISRSFDMAGPLSGAIDAVTPTGITDMTGNLGSLLISASVDEALDHFTSTRFGGAEATAVTFQNITNINSTIYFCRASADEFNYSSNPSYLDDDNRIIVIDPGQTETQQSFTFVTSIGMYDALDNLLAVAKLSRPILKDSERDVTFKVRLDF